MKTAGLWGEEMRVSNQKILRNITWRSLKSAKFRNLIAIFAIVLTAVMFTSVATLGSALVQSVEESTFRQVGTSAHGGFKYLTQAQYDQISQSRLIRDIDYDIILGFAMNPEFSERQHEVRYTGDKKAQWGFCYPTIGRMPEGGKEAALSDITLDLLGLPHELGQSIHLDISVNGEILSDDFTLCGIYEGDEVMWASQIHLSEDYVRDAAPMPDPHDKMNIAGSLNADVWFSNAIDIETKLNDVLTDVGMTEEVINLGVNWGYTSSGELDFTTVFIVVAMLLIIAASGYLIIYSVFAISVSGDIRFYGLLKTIGTTGRQIKGIIRRQALILSLIGIPCGLIFGFLLGTRLAPVMMRMISFELTSEIAAKPWIFAAAAVFSLITVFISCAKPGKMAARVSPIEALRFTEGDATRKRARKGRKVSPFSMAAANVGRSRGKLITVLLSLSLSMVLLNSVSAIVSGFDMDAYLSSQLVSDFYFTGSSLYNHAVSIDEKNFQAITQDFIEEAVAQPGAEDWGRVFFCDHIHKIEDEARLARMDEIVRPYTREGFGEENLDYILSEGISYLQLYGLDKLAFEALTENHQNIDWEKFSSGKYVLMETFVEPYDPETALYQIGETISIEGEDGEETDYEVLGYISYPYAMSSMYSPLVGFTMVLPADEFIRRFPSYAPMGFLLNTDETHGDALESWADTLTSERMQDITYRSKAFYIDEFKSMQNTFLILGSVLAFILALIGILNFVNTIATSIMTRRRELAMLQSVGMTSRQLRQMLFGEGLCYALLTLAFTLTFGSAVSALLTNGIASQIWFFRYHFSLKPVLICAPILLALCALIPLLCARMLQKETVVERLREH